MLPTDADYGCWLGAKTDILVVRGLTGTVRHIIATHRIDKLHKLSAIKYYVKDGILRYYLPKLMLDGLFLLKVIGHA